MLLKDSVPPLLPHHVLSHPSFKTPPHLTPQTCVFLFTCCHHPNPRPLLPLAVGAAAFQGFPPFHAVPPQISPSREPARPWGAAGRSRLVLFRSVDGCPTVYGMQPNFLPWPRGQRWCGLCPRLLAATLPSPPRQPCWLPWGSSSAQPCPSSGPLSSLLALLPPPPSSSPFASLPSCHTSACGLDVTSSEHPFRTTECRNGPSPPHHLSSVICDSTCHLSAPGTWHRGLANSRQQVQVCRRCDRHLTGASGRQGRRKAHLQLLSP